MMKKQLVHVFKRVFDTNIAYKRVRSRSIANTPFARFLTFFCKIFFLFCKIFCKIQAGPAKKVYNHGSIFFDPPQTSHK